MALARSFETADGWIISMSHRATGEARALLLADAQALTSIAPILDDAARDMNKRRGWFAESIATSPAALAIRFPDFAVAAFRISPTELHLVSTPYESMPDELWDALENARAEEVAQVSIPSGLVGICALNADALELAAAVPTLGNANAKAVGIMGEGVLFSVDAGNYVLTRARHEAEEDTYLEHYRLQHGA